MMFGDDRIYANLISILDEEKLFSIDPDSRKNNPNRSNSITRQTE